jgi:hypothetical protein
MDEEEKRAGRGAPCCLQQQTPSPMTEARMQLMLPVVRRGERGLARAGEEGEGPGYRFAFEGSKTAH